MNEHGRNLMKPAMVRHSDDERVLPLINVVFLLLIFFMIAGTFQSQPPLDLKPAESDTTRAESPDAPGIYLDAQGGIAVGERVATMQSLAQAWALEAAGKSSDIAHVYADGDVEASRLVEVMERLRALGVETVQLMTVPRKR